MSSKIWDRFMEKLTQNKGMLDEFCNLSDIDIDKWLEDNEMGVTMDELVAASPKVELAEKDLENVSGGKIVLHSAFQDMVRDAAAKIVIH